MAEQRYNSYGDAFMTTDWNNSFFGPIDFRTKADYDKRRPKKNPEVIVSIETKSRRKRRWLLIQCTFPGCKAKLHQENVKGHFKKVHSNDRPPTMGPTVSPNNVNSNSKAVAQSAESERLSALSLAREVERYLPDIIMRLANDAGLNVQKPDDKISAETAATICAFFKRLSH